MISAKAVLLQLLVRDGESFGTALKARAQAVAGITLLDGGLYPALRALEHEGLAQSAEEEMTRGGRPRRYYWVTPAGVAMAQKQRQQAAQIFSLI